MPTIWPGEDKPYESKLTADGIALLNKVRIGGENRQIDAYWFGRIEYEDSFGTLRKTYFDFVYVYRVLPDSSIDEGSQA
jgi:hypothetical protein